MQMVATGFWKVAFIFSVFAASFLAFVPPALAAYHTDQIPGQEVLVVVKGVATPFSVFGLIKRFGQIPGVQQVSFDLSRGLADIRLKPGAEVTDAQFRRAVQSASYTPGDIRRKPARPAPGDRTD